MADVPKYGRIVPIIAPHRNPSPVSDSKNEQDQPQQLPQVSRSRGPGNTRSKTEAESLELSSLTQLGLYALPTEGDGTVLPYTSNRSPAPLPRPQTVISSLSNVWVLGNCLYYALSDQLYGDFTHADHIRRQLADHISANPEYFMNFIAAAGGERRAPRRAAAEAARTTYCSSSSASPVPQPSIKDTQRSFDSRVAESRKNGVWGGAEEIQAFCQSFRKDVKVYTMYGIQSFRDVHAHNEEKRETVHIAFHVRNAPVGVVLRV